MKTLSAISKPQASEHGAYFGLYVDQVPGEEVLAVLEEQVAEIESWSTRFAGERETFRYEPGKWSVRELIGHMNDTERVFMGRALWFARGDQKALPGFEQDEWSAVSNAGDVALEHLVQEALVIRQSTLLFLRGLNADALERSGKSENNQLSVRAAAWIVAGHLIHHSRVLSERYEVASS
ncbi:MAG: hypothetical protein ACI841_003025 [Planctomycetota bacterium]|jgi:hypothetical protein